jgi:hypothetical protein
MHANHGTRKTTLLDNTLFGVTTVTIPLVASVGTTVLISLLETTLKGAALPPNLTEVAPLRFVPRMITVVPEAPAIGTVLMNGLSPIFNLKIVPK